MLDCTLDYSRFQMKFFIFWFQRIVTSGINIQTVTLFCLCCLVKRYTDDDVFAHHLLYSVLLGTILEFKLMSGV